MVRASCRSMLNRPSLSRYARSAGVTLLELMTVMVVIGILVTMLVPVVSSMTARMERSKCTANLRTVYLGAESYLQDQKRWPQINPALAASATSEQYARLWIAALAPYKVPKESWRCPTVQKAMEEGREPNEKLKERIDYFPTPFDDKEITPHRWATQPWFIERGAVHGDGNLMIFPDGSIRSLDEISIKVRTK